MRFENFHCGRASGARKVTKLRHGLNGSNTRQSALWGKGSKESRSSALWGKGGRGAAALLAISLPFVVSLAPASAASGRHGHGKGTLPTFVPPGLLNHAKAHPNKRLNVIVQGRGASSAALVRVLAKVRSDVPGKAKGLRRRFTSINGIAAQVTGKQLLKLAARGDVSAITRDRQLRATGLYANSQNWPQVAGLQGLWTSMQSADAPAIAVVDSGIDASRADFGGRVVANANLTTLPNNSPGDGYGHGTFVAGIAAGESYGYTGGAPRAKLVSLDVMDDSGMAMTSDVIAAADWILKNKAAYNIRVANFSLCGTVNASFLNDPLDKAVEKLWFNGVVVVTSAGNFGTGQPVTMAFAPANDPFVITVGAADTNGTNGTTDDFAAPWSAFGYTLDGFEKPELSAPGRRMNGPVPPTSTMPVTHPERLVAPGYMWMSGTSFAAPVVAAAAADVVYKHPNWTPDQVKGALMVSARTTAAKDWSLGVGEVSAINAALYVTTPPNPNAALNQFLVSDPSGAPGPVFDAASWANTAQADASWASASWASASWAGASWATASWATASWASASWATASWATASWADASWASASWVSASWAVASWVS